MLVEPTEHRRTSSVLSGGLAGKRVLLAEDDYFIATDLARAFRAMGAHLIGPFAAVDDVIGCLDAGGPVDFAVLDINLRGQMAFPVADRLLSAGVPFVFSTGYDGAMIPERFEAVARCEKPVSPSKIARALCG